MKRMLWLLPLLALGGCDDPLPRTQALPDLAPNSGRLTLGEQVFPFQITTCLLGSPQAPHLVAVFGRGRTQAGRHFEIQADGGSRRVELRVKLATGGADTIYAAQQAEFQVDRSAIRAQGQFHQLAPAGPSPGAFEARCP